MLRLTATDPVVQGLFTKAELKGLRKSVRNRNKRFEESFDLQLEAHGFKDFVREHVFAPPRKFRFDFAFVGPKIAVEVEGGVWRRGGGAHSHPTNIMRDLEKHNLSVVLGWRVLRVTTDQVKNGEALKLVSDFIVRECYAS